MEVMMMMMMMTTQWWWRWMRVPPDPSGDEGGSLLASSTTRSLPAAKFSRTVVSLNVVSPSHLHRAKVFKVLIPSPLRTAGRYGHSTVPPGRTRCRRHRLIKWSNFCEEERHVFAPETPPEPPRTEKKRSWEEGLIFDLHRDSSTQEPLHPPSPYSLYWSEIDPYL